MTTSVLNGYNVGTDVSLSISDPYGDVFPAEALAHVTEFDAESDDVEIKVTPISFGGVPIYQTVWNGTRGRIMFARVNGSFQSMIVSLMDSYYDLGTIPFFTITQTVMNRDGTIDQYMFVGCQWVKPRFGNYRATKEVDLSLDFRAQRVILTGALTPFLQNLPSASAA
jgi:hypothetical protein